MREFLQAQNRERLAAPRGAEVMVSSEQQVRSVIGKKPETFESFTPGVLSKSSMRENCGSLCLVQTGRRAGRTIT